MIWMAIISICLSTNMAMLLLMILTAISIALQQTDVGTQQASTVTEISIIPIQMISGTQQ